MRTNITRVFIVPYCFCYNNKELQPEASEFDEEMFRQMAMTEGKAYESVQDFQKDLNKHDLNSDNFFIYFKEMTEKEWELFQ